MQSLPVHFTLMKVNHYSEKNTVVLYCGNKMIYRDEGCARDACNWIILRFTWELCTATTYTYSNSYVLETAEERKQYNDNSICPPDEKREERSIRRTNYFVLYFINEQKARQISECKVIHLSMMRSERIVRLARWSHWCPDFRYQRRAILGQIKIAC